MPLRSIHHVNMRVQASKLAELREFYCDVIGLSDGWRPPFASRGFWLYAGSEPVVHLVEASPGEIFAVDRSHSNIDHVAFNCSEPEPILAKLRNRGIPYAVSQVPVLGDWQILFRDPLGTGIELSLGANAIVAA